MEPTEPIDLAKLTEAKRKTLDPDNVLTLREPSVVGSTSSSVARGVLARCSRTPEQIAEEAENYARSERIAAWHKLTSKIGDRYSACVIRRWQFHGDQDQHDRQKVVIEKIVTYMQQLPERVQGGSGVMLIGPPGTGKDFLVSCLMRDAILRHGIRVDWANGVDLYSSIRDAIGSEKSERSLISQWVRPTVLCLSDPLPPRGPLTDFQAGMLFQIIDARYRATKPTWVTLNVENRKEAEDRMGAQVVSRLIDGAMFSRCEWSDFRSAKP